MGLYVCFTICLYEVVHMTLLYSRKDLVVDLNDLPKERSVCWKDIFIELYKLLFGGKNDRL